MLAPVPPRVERSDSVCGQLTEPARARRQRRRLARHLKRGIKEGHCHPRVVRAARQGRDHRVRQVARGLTQRLRRRFDPAPRWAGSVGGGTAGRFATHKVGWLKEAVRLGLIDRQRVIDATGQDSDQVEACVQQAHAALQGALTDALERDGPAPARHDYGVEPGRLTLAQHPAPWPAHPDAFGRARWTYEVNAMPHVLFLQPVVAQGRMLAQGVGSALAFLSHHVAPFVGPREFADEMRCFLDGLVMEEPADIVAAVCEQFGVDSIERLDTGAAVDWVCHAFDLPPSFALMVLYGAERDRYEPDTPSGDAHADAQRLRRWACALAGGSQQQRMGPWCIWLLRVASVVEAQSWDYTQVLEGGGLWLPVGSVVVYGCDDDEEDYLQNMVDAGDDTAPVVNTQVSATGLRRLVVAVAWANRLIADLERLVDNELGDDQEERA